MPATKIDSAILVLGMHQSGASVVARTFSLLGYGAPKTLLKDESSQTQRWESAPIVRLNERILEAAQLSWSDWQQGELQYLSAADRQNYQKDIAQTIKSEFRGHKKIVLKDPRISRLAPLYMDALTSMGTDVLPIIVFRNPLEVMASLRSSQGLDEQDSAYLWLRYTLEAEKATRGQKRVFVQYSSFLRNWEQDIARTLETLDDKSPVSLEDAGTQIKDFVDERLKHHTFSATDTIHDERTEGWAATVYSALEVLQKNPTSAHPLEQVDLCQQEFESASAALHKLSITQSGIFESKLQSAQSKNNLLQSELEESNTELEKMRIDAAKQEAEFASTERSLAHLRSEYEALQDRHLETADQKARFEQDIEHRDKLLAETNARAERSDEELQRLKADLANAQKELADQATEFEAVDQSAKDTTAILAKERIEFEEERSKLDSEVEHQRLEISSLEQTLSDQTELLDSLRSSLEEANSTVQALELSLDTINDRLERQKEASAEEVKNHAYKIAGLERSLSRSENETKRMKSDLAHNQGELGKAQSDVRELLPRVKAREKELRQLKRQHWRLKDELAWQKDLLNAVKNSSSWRITAPIRKLKGLLSNAQASPLDDPPTAPAKAETGSTEQLKKNTEERLLANGGAAVSDSAAKHKEVQHPNSSEHIRAIEASGMFDAAYYLDNAPEARNHDGSPLEHYVLHGWKAGRDPSSKFVSNAWLASHPDLRKENICPLYDYLRSTAKDDPVFGVVGDVGKVAVFGAILGEYDDLKEPSIISDNVDYFLFTDGEEPNYSSWRKRHIEYFSHDPTRTARFIKTHPHLYFSEYDWAIWVDANLQIECDPRELILSLPPNTQLATWHHPIRDCVYDEARECLKRNKDHGPPINAMVDFLRSSNFPEGKGMYETSVIVSKQGDPKIKTFMNDWWSHIERFSRRDQLSLPLMLDKHALNFATLANPGVCMRTDPRFSYHRHNK